VAERKEWRDHTGGVLDSVNGFDVIDCETCGFKHIVPIPAPEDLETIYRHKYYKEEKPLYLERHREDLSWWNTVYARWYETFEKMLFPQRRRILDVGSGPGFFLLFGKERGWKTVGIEPSTQAAAFSRTLGLEIVDHVLDKKTASTLGSFDVVHLHDVLEHVPDPREILRLVHGMIEPAGLLSVIVPNDYNSLQQLLRDRLGYQPWWVAPPHHLNYFSFDSLERLLQTLGFEVLRRTATFPMEIFLLMGENYVGEDSIGRRMHSMRKAFEMNLAQVSAGEMLTGFYDSLAARDLGRECVLVARR